MHEMRRNRVIDEWYHLQDTIDARAVGKANDYDVMMAFLAYIRACEHIDEPHFRFSDVRLPHHVPADYPERHPALRVHPEGWWVTSMKAVG